MMGPLPTPSHTDDRPELPRVRLEVRAASGRPVTYEVGAEEFLIGGSSACDLRLPASNLPPVICQFSRKSDGVRARRLTPVLPVLLNDKPLPVNVTTPVASGDRLVLADLEILISSSHASGIVVPKFVPIDTDSHLRPDSTHTNADLNEEYRKLEARRRQMADEVASHEEEWKRRDAELIRRARDLDTRTEELESDRVLWYRRRQEIEEELERRQSAAGLIGIQKTDLDAKERELARLKDELSLLRERLLKEYQERRDELARQQEAIRDANLKLQSDRKDLEVETSGRRLLIDEELRQRRATLVAEIAESEPKLRDLRDREERFTAAKHDLVRQRDLLTTDREVLDKTRATFEAHQAAETERLMTWENTLVDRAAELTRRINDHTEERSALECDRARFQEDLLRLERRTAALEERERAAEDTRRDAEVRLEQLKRDSSEWEETITVAAAEQARLREEAERLDRQKAELDAQSAALAERAGQLEAQQAGLVVQRAKLDRTRQEAEREAAQLAIARIREDEALAELRLRIREAEELRARLAIVQEDAEQERQRLEERDSLLSSGLAEIREQRDALAAEAERVRQKETELDARAADFAEQAGTLKGRMTQALDLQARLEADRVAIREREAALTQAEEARAALQEQLRRRAEDLAMRSASLDELARQVAAERAAAEQLRNTAESERLTLEDQFALERRQVEERNSELDRLAADFAGKDQSLARHLAKLKDVGQAVAAERKALAETRAKWEAERAASFEADRQARSELAAFRDQAAAEIAALREQAPELEGQSRTALERLSAARDMLRGHLNELHDYARVSREDLDAIRAQVREEADRLRSQEDLLNRARAEHRVAVSAFRQQLIDWQGQVTEMKRTLTSSESRLEARKAAVEEAVKQADATTLQLAEQAEQLRRERDAVSVRRTEVERHLGDMREWYRKKLRELAATNAERRDGSFDKPRLAVLDTAPTSHSTVEEIDPGDKQLGELLRAHGLVDGDALNSLWADSGRQRRTLRQVLLASGVITLYQLALIEAGNLDALVLDRFRVIDRLRASPREAVYRVVDPERSPGRISGASENVYLLRHLAEGEMHDAVRPDEFRQRFAAARDAAHPNLATVTDVLDINGRPAVVLEWLTGLASADWPAFASHPGCWVRLATMAAGGIDAAHRHGLVHGRLTSDSFILIAAGVLKVTGFGEPPWLAVGPASSIEPTPATDLRAFGQAVFGWSQLAARRKPALKVKPFPEALLAIIRRLEADPEPPMADTVATGKPYESAAGLLADLDRVARETPFSDDAWDKLLRHVAENAPDAPAVLKRSA
jgi:trichohyalin